MVKRNAFGTEICEIKEVFGDPKVEAHIEKTLVRVFGHLGVSKKDSQKMIRDCIKLAKKYPSIEKYEADAHKLLDGAGVAKKFPLLLSGRSEGVYAQIKPFLLPGTVLDFGCGDGKVGELCKKAGHKVVLSDIYTHPHIKETGIEFRAFRQGENTPAADGEFDNTLVLTVFHHSDDPLKTIAEVRRVTKGGGRVIVIESVYGVDGNGLTGKAKKDSKEFAGLSAEQQKNSNIFFDHFYNRIIHYTTNPANKVNVPFNFNTPQSWKKFFEQNGMDEEKMVPLGLDQSTVPEYHTLHILRVKK